MINSLITPLKKYASLVLIAFVISACQEEPEPCPQDFIQGTWKVDRALQLPPGPTNFYVQYDVEVTGNNWQQLDLPDPFPFEIIGDTLYLNEFGYIKEFYIEEIDESHFKLVYTNYDYTTTPVTTYIGSR